MWFQFNNAGDFLVSLGGQAHSHPRGTLTRVCPHSAIWGQRPPPYKRQGSPAIVIWTQMQGSTLDKPVSVWLCNPTDCCIPCSPALHHLPEPAQTHVHRVSDPIEPSHPLLSPSPPAFSLYQHQGLFQRIGFSHHVAKVLELQHQSF